MTDDDMKDSDEWQQLAAIFGEMQAALDHDELTDAGLQRLRARLRGPEFGDWMPARLGEWRAGLLDRCCRRLIGHGVGDAAFYVLDLIESAPDDLSGLTDDDGAP